MPIAIINGPNLNLLGRREPHIYGSETLDDTLAELGLQFPGNAFSFFQSNSEGEIIDILQKEGYMEECTGIVLNPGAYAHYSIAIADAIRAIPVPVVEVHISNIHSREEFRHTTVTGAAADAVITGCGRLGYRLAVEYLLSLQKQR